jgi:hypothetical protein
LRPRRGGLHFYKRSTHGFPGGGIDYRPAQFEIVRLGLLCRSWDNTP